MGTAFLYGNGGGIKLPFRVIGGTTQPSNPKDGTIWVKTSVPITYFEFSNSTWTSAGVGTVCVTGTVGGSTPTGTQKVVWALNNKVGGIAHREKITLTGCKQVQGSTGNWVNLDAYVYYNGSWTQFSSVNVIPVFTYTGNYEIVNDADETITVSSDNWKIRLLTSGTLTFQALNGAENGIDVFLVGGGGAGGASCYVNNENPLWGGGGGGGGYTNTKKEVSVMEGTSYTVTIGAGGTGVSGGNGNSGGTTSAFGVSANGGQGGRAGDTANGMKGGSGGSGGGRGCQYTEGSVNTASGAGGSDGGNGGGNRGGTGQGTTTREFAAASGKLYCGGGGGAKGAGGSDAAGGAGGGTAGNGGNASANTGGGGGGGRTPANGGSGIVVIRNKR